MQFILLMEFSSNVSLYFVLFSYKFIYDSCPQELEVNGKVTHSLISKQCSHLVLAVDGNGMSEINTKCHCPLM